MRTTSAAQALARQLRANLTPPERPLWSGLRRFRPHGFHFRKQSAFGAFVLDFVCNSRRLVIEVDGHHHADEHRAERDAVRDIMLARQGYRVMRFPGAAVMGNLAGVLEAIEHAAAERAGVRKGGSPARDVNVSTDPP